jgi:glycosyltransferase involved in cell wall biosynthesis
VAVGGVSRTLVILVHTFPLHSTTFIAREARELKRRGVPLAIVSIRRPAPSEIPADALDLARTTEYLLPLGAGRALARHSRAAAMHPAAYAGALARALTRGRLKWHDRVRTLLHFSEAIALRPVLESKDARHLHVHALSGGATIAWLLRSIDGRSYSLTAHGADIFVEKVLLAEKMEGAVFTRVGTEYNRAYLAGLSAGGPHGDDRRVLVMPFGVDTDRFSPPAARRDGRPSDGAPPRNPAQALRLVSVGRLVWEKAHHLLLDACSRLHSRGIDLKLTIVGEGPERAALETQRDRLGLGDRVDLPGALPESDVAATLRSADLFVLSSVSEGFGVVLLEAMACGVPVVAPFLHGIPELVTDGVDGTLFRPGSADDLARAVESAASDPERRRLMGEAGRRKVLASFRLADRVAQFETLLRSTLGVERWSS